MVSLRSARDPSGGIDAAVWEEVEIQVKYENYIEREIEEVERVRKFENVAFPADLSFVN